MGMAERTKLDRSHSTPHQNNSLVHAPELTLHPKIAHSNTNKQHGTQPAFILGLVPIIVKPYVYKQTQSVKFYRQNEDFAYDLAGFLYQLCGVV